MFGVNVNKQQPLSNFNSGKKETTVTNYNKNWHDMRYKTNGGGRDTYIYNDNGGFNAMHGPRQ